MVSASNSERDVGSAPGEMSSGATSLVKTGQAAVTTFDRDGRMISANRRAAQMHGFDSVTRLLSSGWSLLDTVDPDDRRQCAKALQAARSQGRASAPGILLRRADDSSILVDIEVSEILDPRGDPSGFVCVTRDALDQRRIDERELRQHKLESLSLLAGGIAHDFNNILTGILGNIGLAKLNPSDPQRVLNRMAEAEAAIRRARTLTQQLLTFSKGQSLERTNVDLRALLTEAVPFALHGSSVGFELEIAPSLPRVNADEGQIAQVIHNLVINAAHAMSSGGSIVVRARSSERVEGTGVEVTVRDAGEGIAPEQLPLVFDPYFTTKRTGHGLGLATSQAIIHRHHGHIEIASVPGEGTEVAFWLPSGEVVGEQAPARERRSSHPAEKGQRVLVMDDDEVVLDVLRGMLDQLGYRCTCTTDGAKAVAAYRRGMVDNDPYAAVIVDLTIQGGMGGVETITRLRELDRGVRAVVSSGYADDPIVSNPEQYGFVQAVVKPFTVGDLEEALDRVMPGG